MNDDNIDDLLIRYITREATPEEIVFLSKWINAHPENEQHFANLYELWQDALINDQTSINTDEAFEDFRSRNFQDPIISKKRWLYSGITLAALLIMTVGFWKISDDKPHAESEVRLTASKGTSRIFKLSDGTKIWLNGGSALTIAKGFNTVNRTVCLSGEAFFEIGGKESKLPFLVKTKKYAIRDIGTQFNIKAYPGDDTFEASVVQGEISVENGSARNNENNRIYLKAHQVLSASTNLAKAGDSLEERTDDNFQKIQILQIQPDQQARFVGWKENILAFDSSSLEEIAKTLDRRFGTAIAIKDERLKQIRYSGTFKNARSAAEILDVIKENTEITYNQTGNNIMIGGAGL
ncbi:DUF4974 domain-containing protein [Mucilaginibacter sp. 21P]|uniref:FecR family protein n=1 Tax=Mucilaginibacter sp. 21P TaxID=2778902 RepID=UPI001C56FF5A|nr:FecR domain-containing protein [Mucilaginibacter sp. 21P]QXV63845.1 DUF4974 domain-containing protein [Mucilaginibacter sp. 21P]